MSKSASAVSVYREQPSRSKCYQPDKHTLCHQIQLLHQQRLVLCPGKVKCLGRHELGNAMLSEDSLVCQLRYPMETAVLGSGKAGLYVQTSISAFVRIIKGIHNCSYSGISCLLIFILTLTMDDDARRPLCGRTNLCNIICLTNDKTEKASHKTPATSCLSERSIE